MNIAMVSGKGGTGKTLIATNLAHIAAKTMTVNLYDLDVEEPNSHLFIRSTLVNSTDVKMMIPVVDAEKCNYCGICSKICEYHAIISLDKNVLVFPELCHSCYGCLELCPEGAISEGFKSIGQIEHSMTANTNLITGKLKISETATTALIKYTKKYTLPLAEINIHDAPPGSSCPVIEAMKDMDFVLLVAEPTPFGLHDVDLVVQTVKQLNIPCGLVINKAEKNNSLIEEYCKQNNIDIIGKIDQQIEIAKSYARSELISESIEGMDKIFQQILQKIKCFISEVAA
jgi:MinD superfamily P-loop ATPase